MLYLKKAVVYLIKASLLSGTILLCMALVGGVVEFACEHITIPVPAGFAILFGLGAFGVCHDYLNSAEQQWKKQRRGVKRR